MSSDVNKVYILTPLELTVIAAARNIQEIFSMQNEDNIIDENAVVQALNHMYQQQFITNAEDESFVLDDELRELMTAVEEAKKAILIRNFANRINVKVIYVGSKLVAMEQRESNASAVRIYEIPEEELEQFLQDGILHVEKPYKNILDEERLTSETMEKDFILQNEDIEVMGNIVTIVEKINASGNKVSCRMVEKQDKKCLKYEQEKKELEFLKENEFLENIIDMIKEESHDIS